MKFNIFLRVGIVVLQGHYPISHNFSDLAKLGRGDVDVNWNVFASFS